MIFNLINALPLRVIRESVARLAPPYVMNDYRVS